MRGGSFIFRALAPLLLWPFCHAASAEDVPEVYRGIYQVGIPSTKHLSYTSALGLVRTPDLVQTSLQVVPGGLDYRIDKAWSVQAYLLLNYDAFDTGRSAYEVRPVLGITAKGQLAPMMETGVWLRYEARAYDLGQPDSRFQNRLRVQPYIDFALDGPLRGWHAKLEAEPRYVWGPGDDYINGFRARVTAGYKISDTLSVDVRLSREWSRKSSAASLEPSTDTLTVHVVQLLGWSDGHRPQHVD